jgi:putative ABC transport system permease protein
MMLERKRILKKGDTTMTPLLFTKLFRDLRASWPRIVLMILAMSITLVVFSGVLYSYGISGREIPRAYLSTNPASATIIFDRRFDADQMAAIATEARKQPGIIDATARTQFTLQVGQEGGGWGQNPLQIFVAMPNDPMRIEKFRVEQGSWPPAAGEILIDRSSFDLLNLKVGDAVVVQAPNGQATSLRISGVVYYPALAPSYQDQKGHGFISTASLPILGEPVALNELKIQVADQPGLTIPSRDRDIIVATARDLASWLQQTYDVTIREIQVPTPYAHPHQAQADSLLLGLLVFGVAGLLLSAILVATMLNGLFAQQIPQIGIMKAIGARSSRVLQLYLSMTLVIAVTATAIAIVPGILISRAFTPPILTLLGVDAASLAAPSWMYAVVVAAGVGVPLLFSLTPIVGTSRTTVRKALDYRGVSRHGNTATRFGTRLGLLQGLDRTVLLAFRNIFRRRARFLLCVGLLASAGVVFVAGMSTMAGFEASLERQNELRVWDVEVRLAEVNQVSAVALTNLVAEIPNVTRVEGWSILQTSVIPPGQQISITRTYPDQGHGSIAVTVVPPDSSLMAPPLLLKGRWLRPNETGAVVISQAAFQAALRQDLPGVRSGDTIQLSVGGRFTSWQVVGVIESVGDGGGIFITEEGFKAATGVSQPNLLRIVTDNHDEKTRTTVAQEAERVLTNTGIVVRSAASVSRSAAAGAGHMLPLILVYLALSIAMGVVGFAGLASTMSTNVLEGTREFGVMSAIGAPASTVRRLVVLEGIFIAVVSCVIVPVPALLLTAVMIAYLPVPGLFLISVPGVVIWVVVVVVGAALATLAPAYRASGLTVREALAYI